MTHQCTICKKKLQTSLGLKLHEKDHKIEELYQNISALEIRRKKLEGKMHGIRSQNDILKLWVSHYKINSHVILPADYKGMMFDGDYYRIVAKYLSTWQIKKVAEMQEKLWDNDYIMHNLRGLKNIDMMVGSPSETIEKIGLMIREFLICYDTLLCNEKSRYIMDNGKGEIPRNDFLFNLANEINGRKPPQPCN